jgi:hypothetical protein
MEADMHRMLVGLVVGVLMGPATGLAQAQSGNDASIRRLADSQIGRSVDWRIEASPHPLATRPPSLPQQPAKKRSWPGRHPVLFGALVGAGAGLAIEAAVIPGASGGEPHSAYIPMFVCTGAGIGSLVGLIISAAR